MILAAVLLPILSGVMISLVRWKEKRQMHIWTLVFTLMTTVLVWTMILTPGAEEFTLLTFPGDLSIAFRMDGLSMVFAGMISLLWPLAVLYSFEYMEHEEREKIFFMFFALHGNGIS